MKSRPASRLTRHIIISALGQLETQIPAIGAAGGGWHQRLSRTNRNSAATIEPGGIRGIRKDQYALIGVRPGSVELPALELPWWDVVDWQLAGRETARTYADDYRHCRSAAASAAARHGCG